MRARNESSSRPTARHRWRAGASVALCGLAAAVPAATAAASGRAAAAAQPLTFMAAEYSSATGPFWDSVAKAFKAKTGIQVNIDMVSWSNIHQQIATLVQTHQTPDLLNLDTFSNFAASKLLWPASSFEPSSVSANIPANLAAAGKANGTTYALPFDCSSSLLFYNTTLFKQAHLMGAPKNMTQLAADAKAISALPGQKIGFALSLGPEAPQVDWAMFMFNFGGNYFSNGHWTVNSPANLRALTFLRNLATSKETEVNPGSTNRTAEGTWTLFQSGDAGMVIGETALQTALKSDPSVKYAIAPFPTNIGTSHSLGICDYVMGFKKAGNAPELKQFINFIYENQNYGRFISNEGLLPVTKSEQASMATNRVLGPSIQALKTADFAPVGQTTWANVLGAMKNSLGLAVDGQVTPQAELNKLQAVALGKASS